MAEINNDQIQVCLKYVDHVRIVMIIKFLCCLVPIEVIIFFTESLVAV